MSRPAGEPLPTLRTEAAARDPRGVLRPRRGGRFGGPAGLAGLAVGALAAGAYGPGYYGYGPAYYGPGYGYYGPRYYRARAYYGGPRYRYHRRHW